MASQDAPIPPSYSIVPTEKGWLLVIQNEHCSVTQIFASADSARRAVESMLGFFKTGEQARSAA